MTLHNAVMVKEELINVAVLTEMINNYYISNLPVSVVIPIESLIIEINIIKPELISVDLKPLIMEEVILAVSKIVKKIEMKSFIDIQNSEEVADYNSSRIQREYVAISSLEEINFIKMDDIIYCQAEGKYTKFFLTNGNIFLSSKNLGHYELRALDKSHFFRVHKSYIVNMRFIAKIDKRDGMSCQLLNGLRIPISSRKLDEFNRFIRLKE
ncbi:LytR/AlgR family response regulator transcription factor [Flavobacterium sp. W20_MBD1_R3]|uniref:LytR/AlgR family response regulator transcription factor n=1 Tax=Flavobacterium sp. W20_MBD1_R3 TaxID=3240278 RepID=UPI003F936555